MTNDEMIAVLQAEKQGKKIQRRTPHCPEWADIKFSFSGAIAKGDEYRIKPEPREIWVNFYKGGGSSREYFWSDMGARVDDLQNGPSEMVRFREVL